MSVTSAMAARHRATESKRTSPPVLFVIDDDTGVMNALRDDLSRRFGGRWIAHRFPSRRRVPGVFAVGDARYRSIKRVASAVGDGATAVRLVHEHLVAEGASEVSRNLSVLHRHCTAPPHRSAH